MSAQPAVTTAVTHVHTLHSWDSRTSIVATVDALESIGASLALISDHNSYDGAFQCRLEAARRGLDIRIPTAAEVRTDRGDVIVVFEHDDPPPIDTLLIWEELVTRVRDADGLIWLPHPYHGHDEVEDLAAEADVVEVFNARCSAHQNDRAAKLCESSGSVPGFGFDAHRRTELDRFTVTYPARPTILEQLRTTPTCEFPQRTTPRDIAAAEVVYGVHRRSVKKIGFFSAKWMVEAIRERINPVLGSGEGAVESHISTHAASALVLGDIDLVRSVDLGGIAVISATREDSTVRRSRIPTSKVEIADGWRDPLAIVAAIERVSRLQSSPPTLIQGHDEDVLLLADHGERLARSVHFVAPHAELARDLVDKSRFIELAARLRLPVPDSANINCRTSSPPVRGEIDFPVIAKPSTREPSRWAPVAGRAKAMRFDTLADLEAQWTRLQEIDADLIVQTFLPGPERDIVSYHVYVDADGAVVADFSGRKIRTFPAEYGHTTALEITEDSEVIELGRELVDRIGFTGVAKFDFKPDAQKKLRLLEINPRFSLWHHPAAIAGVNIPAMVFADCNGLPRPKAELRPGVQWANPISDALAFRSVGGSGLEWLRFIRGAEAHHAVSRNDPGAAVGLVAKTARAVVRRGSSNRESIDASGVPT